MSIEQELFELRALVDRQGSQSVLPVSTEMANPIIVTPGSYTSVGPGLSAYNAALAASTAWPTANRAIFVPFFITQVDTIRKGFTYNGGVANGNIDVGIYRDRYDGSLDRVVSSGGAAMSGTTAIQEFAFSPVTLRPGRYYMAMACSSATAEFMPWTLVAALQKTLGIAQMASVYPLPATVTLAVSAFTVLPIFGLSFRDLVA